MAKGIKEDISNRKDPKYRCLSDLRFLVGYLGERDQTAWWDTAFLSPTGLRYSIVNFPRSFVAAAGVSVTEAARRLHDSRIGKGGVFHLFRLPPVIEETVHYEMLHSDPDQVKSIIQNRETALEELGRVAVERLKASEGPVQVGTVKTILYSQSLEELAKHYLDAFLHNRKTFPYFMDSGK
jgi:hypothetical protein